jgi:hypothetical protein
VRIRDRTEFNSINSELARRTYDELGNYVTLGLNVTLEQSGNNAYAVVSPPKAYVYGNEVINVSAKRLLINPNTLTQSKTNQYTGVSCGQYYKYSGTILYNFALDGTRYRIYNGTTVIGSCSIANVTPGRIYVYAITRLATYENTVATMIENTVLSNNGVLYESNSSGKLFDAGKSSMNSISDVNIVQRKRIEVSTVNSGLILPAPVGWALTSNILAIDTGSNTVAISNVAIPEGKVNITFANNNAKWVYYDEIVSGTVQDALEELDVYVKSLYANGKATIGLPNAIQLPEAILMTLVMGRM